MSFSVVYIVYGLPNSRRWRFNTSTWFPRHMHVYERIEDHLPFFSKIIIVPFWLNYHSAFTSVKLWNHYSQLRHMLRLCFLFCTILSLLDSTIAKFICLLTFLCTYYILSPNPEDLLLKHSNRASLVAQWVRIHLPMQGTWVQALVREDPTCRGATKPVRHNYWTCALEPASHNYWSLHA